MILVAQNHVPKISWPPEAVNKLLEFVDENKGEDGVLIRGAVMTFSSWAERLREQYAQVPAFGRRLQAKNVESKLKSLWTTYKAGKYGKKAPLKHFYMLGTGALDMEKLKKQQEKYLISQEDSIYVEGLSGIIQQRPVGQACVLKSLIGYTVNLWCLYPTLEHKGFFKDLKDPELDDFIDQLYGPNILSIVPPGRRANPVWALEKLHATRVSESRRMANEMVQYLPFFVPDMSTAVWDTLMGEALISLPLTTGPTEEYRRQFTWADLSDAAVKIAGSRLKRLLESLYRDALDFRFETYMDNSVEYKFNFPTFTDVYQNEQHIAATTDEEFPHGHVLLGYWPMIRKRYRDKPGPFEGEWKKHSDGVAIFMDPSTKDLPQGAFNHG
ncbi:hypothetical protein LTR84_011740 [Exophiala bonariae]|uniref:Uncharacterized protein n=1 Tax=Exophiala bonariae TaxID=1690606 RepID=A0AAV9NL82_9EURO|nr:hypothetical protein LTR84_011740 [Exophiala bonariae]